MNYIILLSGLFLLSFTVQQNPIHKRWNLVAEEITYYNLDYTRYTPTRDRLDSITGETVEFLAKSLNKNLDEYISTVNPTLLTDLGHTGQALSQNWSRPSNKQ